MTVLTSTASRTEAATSVCPAARLGFISDTTRPGEDVYRVDAVIAATGNFGGNADALAVLEAISGQPGAALRFALRQVAVAELTPGLMDTNASRVAQLHHAVLAGAVLPPVVVAGALLVDGNHRTARAVADGQASVTAFVLLTD